MADAGAEGTPVMMALPVRPQCMWTLDPVHACNIRGGQVRNLSRPSQLHRFLPGVGQFLAVRRAYLSAPAPPDMHEVVTQVAAQELAVARPACLPFFPSDRVYIGIHVFQNLESRPLEASR